MVFNIKIYTNDTFHNNSQMDNSHLAKPCVYQEVTNVMPVNHPPNAKYAHGNNNKPDHPTKTNRSRYKTRKLF